MNDEKLKFEIALTQVPMVGFANAKKLAAYFGSASEIFKASKAKLMRVPGIGEMVAEEIHRFKDFKRSEEEVVFIRKHKITSLFYSDEAFPERLRVLPDAPALLFHLGNTDLNHPKIVGIVGTRKATEYGKMICEKLIEGLVPYDCLIVSGLAYGIDIAAHRAALKNNLKTLGVVGHGLNLLYPPGHKSTAAKMVTQGGIVTEYMSEATFDPKHFPARNRIVAGLSDAVVIVEASEKGGALITAEYGNSYNKDVFAIPGRANDEFSRGCNKLIKQNKAALIENADDLIYMMGWNTQAEKPKQAQKQLLIDLTDLERKIIEAVSEKEKVHVDEIAAKLEIPGSEIALVLLNLEFNGILKSLPGKFYSRG